MSQVVSGQIQPKTGLAESHQIKLICEKRAVRRGSPSLFWVLNVRQEGTDSEDKELLFHNKVHWQTILILKLTSGSLGGASWKETPKTQFECTECLGTARACTLDVMFLIAIYREK